MAADVVLDSQAGRGTVAHSRDNKPFPPMPSFALYAQGILHSHVFPNAYGPLLRISIGPPLRRGALIARVSAFGQLLVLVV